MKLEITTWGGVVLREVFALDVGTRTVVGLWLAKAKTGYKIRAAVIEEHRERAMLDGQIHDIPKVAQVITRVRESLEKRSRQKITKVAVAAAGRSLKTIKSHARISLAPFSPVSSNDLEVLLLEALRQAETSLGEGGYHCVGYSLVGYTLDKSSITNPLHQYGRDLESEVIATFLPRVVVQSLASSLNMAGLSMDYLTLEPIAAAGVAVPDGMRGLNLALVDIGAGTSDIAVMGRGSVVGYDMVPEAGDELTDFLTGELLLDFAGAETVKRSLGTGQEITYTDVVGGKHCVPAGDILQIMAPVINNLAGKIAEHILILNGKPPQAVILVGGGSQVPGLAGRIAENLGLSSGRVAVRRRDALQDISGAPWLAGPEAVTPLGIGVAALSDPGLGMIHIQVNGLPVTTFGRATVGSALLAGGIEPRQLYGGPGMGLSLTVNGKLAFVRGGQGRQAVITLNGFPTQLEDPIGDGDILNVEPAARGENARAMVKDVVKVEEGALRVNDRLVFMKPLLRVNGESAIPDTPIEDNAVILCKSSWPARDVLITDGWSGEKEPEITINGQKATADAMVVPGDIIAWNDKGKLRLKVNGHETVLFGHEKELTLSHLLAQYSSEVDKGKKLLKIRRNGEEAGFTTLLHDGDDITLVWS